MYRNIRSKIQNNIEIGKSKPKLGEINNLVKNNVGSPTSSDQINNSFMSKIKSAIEGKSEFLLDNKDDHILTNYRTFFIERKTAIIDEWLKRRLKTKSKKVKLNKNKFNVQNESKSRNNPEFSPSSPIDEESNDEANMHPSDEEFEIANKFLSKFLIQSEASIDGHIDLNLVLKAIPNKINNYLIHRVELFNFRIFQDSLIGHQNKEIVDAFENFDMRNKDRVYSIKENLLRQKKELLKVREVLSTVQHLNVDHQRAASADKSRSGFRKKINFDESNHSDYKKLDDNDND